jgi:hypothetical protein
MVIPIISYILYYFYSPWNMHKRFV